MKTDGLPSLIDSVSNKLPETTNEADKLISGVLKFLNIFVAPFRVVGEVVDTKLTLFEKNVLSKAQKIPEEHLKNETDISIIGPTSDVLKYACLKDHLREMFENLVVSSIDSREIVFPSFVDIVRQMNEDEAKLLKYLCENNIESFPIVELQYSLKNGGYYTLYRNFSIISYGVCEKPDLISSYLDDFVRFGLIEIPQYQSIKDETVYEALENHPEMIALKTSTFEEEGKFDFSKRMGLLTHYGKLFVSACVKEK